MDIIGLLARDPVIDRIARRALRAPGSSGAGRAAVRLGGAGYGLGGGVGQTGSAVAFFAGALARVCQRPVILVYAHGDDAESAVDELAGTQRHVASEVCGFPALETLPGESAVSLEAVAQRLATVRTLARWDQEPLATDACERVMVTTISAMMQGVPEMGSLERVLRRVMMGSEIPGGPSGLVRWLDGAGYTRVESVEEPGQFAARGGILDVFPPGDPGVVEPAVPGGSGGLAVSLGGVPVRLEFLGDTVERIVEVDVRTMAADRALAGVQVVAADVKALQGEAGPSAGAAHGTGATHANIVNPGTLLPRGSLVIYNEVMELTEQGRGYFERLINSAGIFGPPAVFKAIGERVAAAGGGVIELTAIGQYTSGEDHMIELPISGVPPLDHDVGSALCELASMAVGVRPGSSGDPGTTEVEGGEPMPPLCPVVVCGNEGERQRLNELIQQHVPADRRSAVMSMVGYVQGGFVVGGEFQGGHATLVLPYSELLHRFTARRRGRGARLRAGRAMDTFLELEVGDYVVHQDYGIARFTGLAMLAGKDVARTIDERLARPGGYASATNSRGEAADEPQEYLTLEFEAGAKLHVPAVKVDLVQKYIGGGGGGSGKGGGSPGRAGRPGASGRGGGPVLSRLGGDRWKAQKARVAESVRDLAAELLRVRAARESTPGVAFPPDTPWQKAFEDAFPYEETHDQIAALGEIKRDQGNPRPMDRLLCGDVGFGKTELAVRAAFKAAEAGKQVAVLVPTTVLAEQHERTFADRLAGYPFVVESISRFKTDAEVRGVLDRLAVGRVDVIIGTHRLLSRDVRFKDLGLVVVDEEQRFGVEHKERLLSLRMTADVLTLSATPIPRTLHMGMMGLRDISSLTTAPVDRRAVVTEVIPHNPQRLAQVIGRELARDGQVFYVHNRVHDIHSVADDVQKLAPSARIVVGHGQMSPGDLEDVMHAFVERPPRADILVSTTIIESGIDIPTANTIIIEDADRFGLAELHQLRGRVGRSRHRGYCYLLLPEKRPLKEKAKQRLKALEQFSMLGAGFKIAMRDLEIRGAGNILGPEQSGHIAAVGYDMYCQLLDRAVKGLKNEAVAVPSETAVEIGISGGIPRPYIPSDMRRLEAYRRVATAATTKELARIGVELADAYGPLPPPVTRLLDLAWLRAGARAAGVRLIVVRGPDVVIKTADPEATRRCLHGASGKVTVLPPPAPGQLAEVYWRPDQLRALEPPTLLTLLRNRFVPPGADASPDSNADQSSPSGGRRSPPRSEPSRAAVPPTQAIAGGLAPVKKPTLKPPPLSKSLKQIKRSIRDRGQSL